jgi:hypothetical protein
MGLLLDPVARGGERAIRQVNATEKQEPGGAPKQEAQRKIRVEGGAKFFKAD